MSDSLCIPTISTLGRWFDATLLALFLDANFLRFAAFSLKLFSTAFLAHSSLVAGTLRIADKKSNFYKKHDHIELIFQNGKLIFNDPRRFGSMHLVTEPSTHFLLEKLGPEPLSKEFNGEYLFHKIKKSLSPIKNSLMNQQNVVGIGNIYANEILFDANIRPTRKSKTLKKKEYNAIAKSAKKILKHAIKAGGTTLQDFYKPDGNKGYFKIDLAVYDRADKKCKKCKKESIKRIVQSQRATFYCRTCQV